MGGNRGGTIGQGQREFCAAQVRKRARSQEGTARRAEVIYT